MLPKSSSINVTCVVNAHKESHLIYPTLYSVKRAGDYARQCGLTIEYMVILDSSDEDTVQIVEREMSGLANIHHVKFGDLALSRNCAIENATGKYTVFIDGDDLWGKSWVVDAFIMAEQDPRRLVLHPEFNIYFGSHKDHIFRHIDMESPEFVLDFIYERNYWTALSFARTDIFQEFPYRKNTIRDGFGYEDWTWNFDTVSSGILHKVVPSSCHFIRRGKQRSSLLDITNSNGAHPRILKIYRKHDAGDISNVAERDERQKYQIGY